MRFSIPVALGLLAVGTPALADDAQSLIQAVETKYADVQAMSAQFVQITRSDLFGEERQKGEVVLERPSKMRWDFGGDQARQFVTDGETMWVWSQAENQVIRYDDLSEATSHADSLLQSLSQLDELFEVEAQDADEGHSLTLTPREADQFQKMDLQLDDELVLQRVVVTDSFDNITELEFSDVKLSVDVPAGTFDFEVPQGAEVIEGNP